MAKKKTAASKAAKAVKNLKDIDKGDKKKRKKTKQTSAEDDIDKILAELKIDRKNKVIEEHQAPHPSRRANATFIPHPQNANELVMFGGEHYDNQRVYMYNDLYRYKIDKNEWTRVTSPNSPGPRSSHQLVASSTGLLFMFGGEYVSSNETNFFHYRDFWSFDLKLNVWTKLETKLMPSPRSGHRMVQYKQFLILFGGFYDVGVDVRYYDDFWSFDCQRRVWKKLDHSNGPSARSGFTMYMHQDCLYIYGGYSKLSKGRNAKGVAHSDLFSIKLNVEFKNLKWDRLKKVGVFPNPRCGMAPVYSKGRLILFGGVTDVEEVEDGIKSICHDDMYNLAIDANRWFPFTLKQQKAGAVEFEKPCQRFNAMTLVVKNTLYLYVAIFDTLMNRFGGVVEAGSKEFTLNDLWSLSLDKLVQWVCIAKDETIETIDWVAEESEHESDNESIDTEDDSENESCDEEESDEEESKEESDEDEPIEETQSDIEDRERTEELELKKIIEANITPARGEKLGPYFTRTITHWETIAFKKEFNTGKILRTKAFDLAKIGFAEFVEAMGELSEGEAEEEGDLQIRSEKDKPASRPRR